MGSWQLLAGALLMSGVLQDNSPGTSANGWSMLADRDLQAIHDVIAANHPGPVDPQNPKFGAWLDSGLGEAKRPGRSATSYSDYRRALLFYTNGFRDTHIGTYFLIGPSTYHWPGFVARLDAGRLMAVGGAHDGDRILSCDGKSPEALLRQAVDPFFWNPEVPHQSHRFAPQLFMLDNAEYFVRTFIRGPVCRGQIATDVIRDNFWALFQAPEHDP